MESAAEQAEGARDRWMRRAGPFYSLLVAARAQTRLPLASDLDPAPEDLRSAAPWGPAVGALLGLALAFFAAVVGEIGLASTVVAVMVACGWMLLGGGWAELGTARVGSRLLGGDAQGASATGVALTFSIVLVVSLLLRASCLIGTDAGYWTEALVVAAVLGRWTPLAASLAVPLWNQLRRQTGDRDDDASRELADGPSLLVGSIATLGVSLVAVVVGGVAGLTALAIAAGFAALAALTGSKRSGGALVLATELVTLICFAAANTYPLLGD